MHYWDMALEALEQNVEWVMGDGLEWSGVDTPKTVMTTKAIAVLTKMLDIGEINLEIVRDV